MEKNISFLDDERFKQKCKELIEKYDIKDLRLILREGRKMPHIPFLKYTPIKDPYISIAVFSEWTCKGKKEVTAWPLVYVLEKLEKEKKPIRKDKPFAIKPLSLSLDGISLTYEGDVSLYVDGSFSAYPFSPVSGKWVIGDWKTKGRWPREDKGGKFSDSVSGKWREEPPIPSISMKDFIEDKSGAYETWFAKIIRPAHFPKKLLLTAVFYSPSRGLIPWEEIASQLREVYLNFGKN